MPLETSTIVPPPDAIDPVVSNDPLSAKSQIKTSFVDTDAKLNACHSFAEYYQDNFKSDVAVWEPIHSKFARACRGRDCPHPASIHVDVDAIKSCLNSMETDLYNIDGPQHTWNLKKSLRRRVQLTRERVSAARPLDSSCEFDNHYEVCIPMKPHEACLEDEVCIASNCYDDREPRRPLTSGTHGVTQNTACIF